MKPRLREISRFVPGRGWIHPTEARRTTANVRDVPAILSQARVLFWKLAADPGQQIDPAAQEAVTVCRWGASGKAFAARIIAAVGGGDDAALEAAIVAALTKKWKVRR
jgi:hypothetical protein